MYDGLSEAVAFAQIEVFYTSEWTKRWTTWKWILTIFKYKNECYEQLEWKNQMKKMGSFVYFPCFLPELWPLNVLKTCISCNFVLTSARNVSLWKQFPYMHLNSLITLFQEMVWFIGVWATTDETLAIKISKKMPTQQKFNKVLWLQTLISLKQQTIT